MSCQECRILYLEDQIATFTAIATRMSNVMHCSENSQDVSDAQKANVQDIKDLRETWDKHECKHDFEAFRENVRQIEAGETPKLPEIPKEPAPGIGITPKRRGRPPGRGRSADSDQVRSGDVD